MELVMCFGTDYIDSISIDQSLITWPGYLGGFVRLLRSKNEQELQKFNGEPDFLLLGMTTERAKQKIQLNSRRLNSKTRGESIAV
jgi:hypothetical protein